MRPIAVFQILACSALTALLPLTAFGDSAPSWRVAPREAWVAEPPTGVGPTLHDRQIRIGAQGDDRYEHTVLHVSVSQAGDHLPVVSVNIDPRYQLLVLHSLRLMHARDAARVFSAAGIRELVRAQAAEAEPHKAELNPLRQISIQLPDAHAGDLIECEYTVHSLNAQYPGLIVGHYAAQWLGGAEEPLRWERLRVLWPPARALQFRISDGAAGRAPTVETHVGELDIQWRDQFAPSAETDTPRWFTPQNMVQLSDFSDWAQVAGALAPHYAAADPADTAAPGATATAEMILDALHLVQSKVRATNVVSNGPYAPAEPAVVLQRGFGDSRDLARLLAYLLRRLGADAQVALADSHRGALLETSLPSPYILDSGLVLVALGAKRYWINPAAAGPATALETTDTGDLRHALLLANSGGKVVLLPPAAPDSRLRSLSQSFDLRAGNAQPAALTVTTQYRGSWAQGVRAELLAQSPAQLQLGQIQGVVQDYPTAIPQGDVELKDQPASQALQLTARFRLPQPLGETGDSHFTFYAESLAQAVQPRDEPTRRLPLSVPWPMTLEHRIEAQLPPDFQVQPGSIRIDNPAFHYQRDVRVAQGSVQISHRYVSLADHVDPADYGRFLQANAQVYQLLGLRVTPTPTPWRQGLAWLGAWWIEILGTTIIALTLLFAVWSRLRRS